MELINREKEEVDINLLSPLTWAYVGDAVYELYVRTNLVNKTKLKPHKLHIESIKYVKAKAQADILKEIMDKLTDDEKEIVDLLEVYLKNENYNVYKFYTSEDAIKCIDTVNLDIAILDVMIQGKNGFEICKYIREKKLRFPVIMLTAKIEDNDKIKGLTLRGR